MRRPPIVIGLALIAMAGLAVAAYWLRPHPEWTTEQVTTLRSLWIGSLPPLPPDP